MPPVIPLKGGGEGEGEGSGAAGDRGLRHYGWAHEGIHVVSISGVCKLVCFMPSFTHLTLTGPHKPPGEPLSVLPSLAPECLVEEERKKGSSISRSPLQAL